MSFPPYLSPYKSKGEKRIADYFDSKSIKFTYEKPIAVVDNSKTKIWYPDFTLMDYHILVEYLGMTGKSDNDRINNYKRRVYKKNSIDLIELRPSDFNNDWQGIIERGIHDTLEGRLHDFTQKAKHELPTSQYVTDLFAYGNQQIPQ